jgi:hypothetical protein
MRSVILLFLAVLCTQQSFARQSCDWPFRTTITITQSDFNGLTDYPVDLFLSGSNLHSQYQWSSNGSDLRIYSDDDTTALPFTINSWDAIGQGANVRVSFPNFEIGTRTIYVYYGNQSAASASTSVPDLPFVTGKIKYHTRSNNGSDPDSYAEAKSVFNQGNDTNTSYGCSHPDDFTGITNQNQGSGRSPNNFIAYSKTLFTVQAGESGNWGIRYGADFGLGGGLYVDTVNVLDEKWTDDLWWGGSNWASGISDVLYGSVYLSEGEHEMEIIGGEGCCDGGVTVQFSRDYSGPTEYSTATWYPFTSTNIDIRSEACPIPSLSISYGSHDVCYKDLSVTSGDSSSQSWVAGSSYSLDLSVNNLEVSEGATSETLLDITLPIDITLHSYSGGNWSCIGTTGIINCIYDQTISASSTATTLSLTLLLNSGSTVGDTLDINATVTGSAPESDTSNNSISFSINVLTNVGVPAGCPSPQSGLLVSFFDIEGNELTSTTNQNELQSLVDTHSVMGNLQGQTIFSQINGSGNPFIDTSTYFLTIFEGYLYTDTTIEAKFGVDGYAPVEAWLDGSVVSNDYRVRSPRGDARDKSGWLDLLQGFTPIEFRAQGVNGASQYDFYWRPTRSGSFGIIPSSAFYHCAGDPEFQLSTTVNVVSDPINGTTFPKAIPFAVMTYTVTAQNPGNISTDVDSTVLVQALASNTQLFVDDFDGAGSPIKFTDGTGNTASGVSYEFNSLTSTSDSISFSTDGTNFNHSPTSTDGYDAAITHFKLTLPGTFKPTFDGVTPTFDFEYQVQVK